MKAHRIEGAVALVTGASRGIGRALVQALLDRGARKVYAAARVVDELAALGDARLVPLHLDVTSAGQIRAVAAALARNGGAVVNVSSLAGLTAVPALPTYSASKAALHALTQAARALLAAQGTSVFEIFPGPVDTDMTRGIALPKASARDVASAILDGVEAGQEDIFPDPFAGDFARQFESSPKASERQFAGITPEALFGAAA